LLSVCPAEWREAVVDHPSMGLLRQISASLKVDSSVPLAFLELQAFSPGDLHLVSLEEMLAWARTARAVAGMGDEAMESQDSLDAIERREEVDERLAHDAVEGLEDISEGRVLDETQPDSAPWPARVRRLTEAAWRGVVPCAGLVRELTSKP
jgi:hypothetical protein